MSFLDVLSRISDEDIAKTLDVVTDDEILSTLSKAVLDIDDGRYSNLVILYNYSRLCTFQTIVIMVACIVDIDIIVGLLVKS